MNVSDKNMKKVAITLTVIAAVLFALLLIPQDAFDGAMILRGFAAVDGSVFAIIAVVYWIKYAAAVKKDKAQYLEHKRAMEHFDEWVKNFDHLTKIAAELVRVDDDEKRFSKFGGLPTVPYNFVWPQLNGKSMPFLLQIDFSEINTEGRLRNFPTSGLMYLFVEEVFEPEYDYVPKILFFDNAVNLSCAERPNDLQKQFVEFAVAPNIIKTYPNVEDCDEAFEIYCQRPFGGLDDGYDALSEENLECHLVGGWPSHLQNGGYAKDCKASDGYEWVLLAQIKSEMGDSDDDEFMWGDDGIIYVYIREKDLLARRFDNVKLDMQCY